MVYLITPMDEDSGARLQGPALLVPAGELALFLDGAMDVNPWIDPEGDNGLTVAFGEGMFSVDPV